MFCRTYLCQVCNSRVPGNLVGYDCTSRCLPTVYQIVPQEGAVAEIVIGTIVLLSLLKEELTGKSGEQF